MNIVYWKTLQCSNSTVIILCPSQKLFQFVCLNFVVQFVGETADGYLLSCLFSLLLPIICLMNCRKGIKKFLVFVYKQTVWNDCFLNGLAVFKVLAFNSKCFFVVFFSNSLLKHHINIHYSVLQCLQVFFMLSGFLLVIMSADSTIGRHNFCQTATINKAEESNKVLQL